MGGFDQRPSDSLVTGWPYGIGPEWKVGHRIRSWGSLSGRIPRVPFA